ncbi:MAG: hypothetical protein AABX89_07390 [Candidatus Thermoplasmatota archaeon]
MDSKATALLVALAILGAGGATYAGVKATDKDDDTATPPNGQPDEVPCSTGFLDGLLKRAQKDPVGCVTDLTRTQAPTGSYKRAFLSFDGDAYTHIGPSFVNPQATGYQASFTSYGVTGVKLQVILPDGLVAFTKELQRGQAGLVQVDYLAHDAGDAIRIIDAELGTTTINL